MATESAVILASSGDSLKEFLNSALKSTKPVDVSLFNKILSATSPDKRVEILKDIQLNGKTIVHHAALYNFSEVVQCISGHLKTEEFYSLVAQEDNSHCLPLHNALDGLRYDIALKDAKNMIDSLICPLDVGRRCKLIEKAIESDENLFKLFAAVNAPTLAVDILSCFSWPKLLDILLTADESGNTAFHWLVWCPDESGHTESLLDMIPADKRTKLLEKKNYRGQTPLYIASRRKGKAFATLLSMEQKGLDYFVETWATEDRFWCPEGSQFSFILDQLSAHTAQNLLNQTWKNDMTMLDYLAARDDVEAVQSIFNYLLLDQFCLLLDVSDGQGRGPLHRAAANVNLYVLEFIITALPCEKLSALLTTPSRDGETPIGRALKQAVNVKSTIPLQKLIQTVHRFVTGQHKHGSDVRYCESVDLLRPREVMNLKERISELEKEVQVKDSIVEGLPEVVSLKKRISELEEEVQLKDSQLEEREFEDDLGCKTDVFKEVISLQERISELETQLKVKDCLVEDLQAKINELEEKLKTNAEAAEGDKSEDEGSFDSSSDDDSFTIDPNYTNNALPEDLRQAILDVCDKRKVRNPRILQGLLDYKEVTVVGIGVWQFEDGDLTEIKERWPDNCNSISVLEEKSDESDEEFYGNRSSGISKFLLNQPPPVDGICELVVEVDHEELGQKTAYLVGAAHCILSAERVQQLRDGVPPSQVRQQLDADARGCHYRALFRTSPHEEVFVDAFHVPCFGYRRTQGNAGQPRLNADGIDLQRCRNDMALLRIDPSKADKLYHVFRDLEGRRDKHVKINRQMLEKFTRPPVQEGNRIRISVNNQDGFLVPYRNADGQLEPGDVYHLRFVLDIDGRLGPGDSGRVVYKVGTTNGQRSLRPLGLFVGRSRRRVDVDGEQQTVYLAVFIDLAFQDIIDEYEKIRSIYLKGSFKKGPRLERPPTTTRPAAANLPR